MAKHIHTVDFQIGEESVLLRVAFNFTPGRPMTGPTWSCGGTPAEPAEADITSLEWSRDNKKTRTYEWHKIEGALFELIAEDSDIYIQLCDAVEAESEDDADRRYDAMRDEPEFV
jgi:hypothetical protein